MATIRLFVAGDLRRDAAVGLDPKQAHYLKNVMRLSAGDELLAFNGRDGEWRARIEGLAKSSATLRADRQTRPQASPPDLWLLFAPVKRGALDLVARASTELGVSVIQPVITERTVVARVRTDRLAANAIEAAEQCGRLGVPEVREAVGLDRLLADWPADRHIMVCDETGAGVPVGEALGGIGRNDPWAVMIGPEGGYAPNELDRLTKHPIVTKVGLGPRTLRAETATIAALACWQAMVGDWR